MSSSTQDRRPRHRGGTRRRRWQLGLASTVLAALAVFAHASSASAFVISADPVNQPGKVAIPGFCTGAPAQCRMIEATGETHDATSISVAPVTVSATTGEGIGGGEQKISVTYRLERRDAGEWTTLTSTPNNFRWLYPGQETQLPTWTIAKPDAGSVRQEYRIEAVVTWTDVATRYLLGEVHLAPSAWGDALCATNADYVPCTPTRNGGLSL